MLILALLGYFAKHGRLDSHIHALNYEEEKFYKSKSKKRKHISSGELVHYFFDFS